MLLVAVALFYALAAIDLERTLRGAAGAILVRAGGGAAVLVFGIADGEAALVALGVVDMGWAVLHYLLLRRRSGAGLARALLRG